MSELEETLLLHIKAAGLPTPEREVRFAPPRRWRFDLAYVPQRIAIEVDGGTYIQGRHSRGAGYANDCRKRNAATIAGWTVLNFTTEMVVSGEALAQIEQALKLR
jgi:very-short-patch-repair endonuclease